MERNDWMEVQYSALHQQYGGSGMNVTWTCLQEMVIPDILWFVERLNRAREHEAEELEKIRR